MLLGTADTLLEASHHHSHLCSALRDAVADASVYWEDAQAELLQFNVKEIFFIYSLIFTTCGSAQ